ncbi:Pr6Pr family membrane protein [soil metagenome]
MIKRYWVTIVRLAFSLLILVAIGVQFNERLDVPGFRPANFFSFFTIQSNVLAAAMLLYSAVRAARPDALPRRDILRGAVTLYLLITGIVYGVLLSGYQDALQTTIPWVDTVLHRIIPLVIVADWLLDPPVARLRWRFVRWWLAYPVAYVVYSLIRGPIVDWYPYPFLDPGESGGYLRVALYCAGITTGVVFATLLLVWNTQRRVPEST